MLIRAKTDFLDGRYRFTAGECYDVPDRRGGVYVANGWATEGPAEDSPFHIRVTLAELSADAPLPAAPDVVLAVQDVGHATTQPEV